MLVHSKNVDPQKNVLEGRPRRNEVVAEGGHLGSMNEGKGRMRGGPRTRLKGRP